MSWLMWLNEQLWNLPIVVIVNAICYGIHASDILVSLKAHCVAKKKGHKIAKLPWSKIFSQTE